MLAVVLLSLSAMAFAQSDAQKPSTQTAPPQAASAKPAPTQAQLTFNQLKSLAGTWEGQVTMNPPFPGMKEDGLAHLQLTMRVTSRGNAIVHEFQESNTPLDPSRYDHPVTMFYLDSDQINLVHYCDAGNRPRMTAKPSPDGKTVEFEFADLSGGNGHGHMHHAVFTFIDANHHIEEWTYMLPGNKEFHGRMELHRVKDQQTVSSNR
jgi:hypothetical protein